MEPYVDIMFPIIQAGRVPVDHYYALYSSVYKTVNKDWLHGHEQKGQGKVGLHIVTGNPVDGCIEYSARTEIGLRLPVSLIPAAIALSAKVLEIKTNGHRNLLPLGISVIRPLEPKPCLKSHIVHIKTEDSFPVAVEKQLDWLGIAGKVDVSPYPKRITIRGKTTNSYGVRVSDLSPEDSMKLQIFGIGGHRHQGCGVFR